MFGIVGNSSLRGSVEIPFNPDRTSPPAIPSFEVLKGALVVAAAAPTDASPIGSDDQAETENLSRRHYYSIIASDPRDAAGYSGLASTLEPGETITLRGRWVSDIELLLAAVKCNPLDPLGYYMLGYALKPNQTVEMRKDVWFGKRRLFIVAYELARDDRELREQIKNAQSLLDQSTSTLPEEKIQTCITFLPSAPITAQAASQVREESAPRPTPPSPLAKPAPVARQAAAVSSAIQTIGRVKFKQVAKNGNAKSQAAIYLGHATRLKDSQTAEAIKRRRDYCLKAIECDPGYALAYYHLALLGNEPVVITGETMDPEALLIRAIQLKSDFAEAFFELGKLLPPNRRVVISNRSYGKGNLLHTVSTLVSPESPLAKEAKRLMEELGNLSAAEKRDGEGAPPNPKRQTR